MDLPAEISSNLFSQPQKQASKVAFIRLKVTVRVPCKESIMNRLCSKPQIIKLCSSDAGTINFAST